MFFITRFIIVWAIWFLLADKKRWRELFLVSIFAALFGHISDTIMKFYKLWDYEASQNSVFDKAFLDILNDIGIYVVTTYLFIQYLPKKRTPLNFIMYWTFWVALALFIEWIHLVTGHMVYHKWWNLWWSALSDFILFGVFYKIHKAFKLELLP